MQMLKYSDASSFLEDSQRFLEREEAVNNLILGQATSLQKDPGSCPNPLFLGVKEEGELVFAGLQTATHRPMVVYGKPELAERFTTMLHRSLSGKEQDLRGFIGKRSLSLACAGALGALTGRKFETGMNSNVYRLQNILPITMAEGRLRPAHIREARLLSEWTIAFGSEAIGNEMDPETAYRAIYPKILEESAWVWEVGGEAVSMACTARRTRNYIAVNYVYTPLEFRKKGYASSLVAKLSGLLLDNGINYCTLFADKHNSTTNKIYRLMGYEPVAEFLETIFPVN